VAAPSSLLRGARAMSRDQAREMLPPGYLWDVCDWVPQMIDSLLTSRGGWIWGSATGASADFNSGILAPYTAGEQNLANAGGTVYAVDNNSPFALTNRGSVPAVVRQNPVMLFDQVVWMDGNGASPPVVVPPTGAPAAISPGTTIPRNVRYGTIWGEYFVGANQVGHEDTVYWGPPDDITQPWDNNAFWRTTGAVTGLAALRTVILVFHASSIERLRGTRPPAGTSKGDMVLEPLFQQVGTTEPKTICYWQENVLFADEHGVHITDGAVLRNLIQQGSMSTYWRGLYNQKQTISATVFLDYYVVSIIRNDGSNDCLICDLNARQWFRFSNIAVVSMWASGGTIGMERFWGGVNGAHRLGRFSSCFFPIVTTAIAQDANGTNVLPYLETGWYRLSQEGRKRVRFSYLSYDARVPAAGPDPLKLSYIVGPADTNWTAAGTVPATLDYSRWRLPVGKAPYGIAFRIEQVQPTNVTRVSDIAVDAHTIERSRV